MSASGATLSGLRDRVEAKLVDEANAIWATGTLDEAIREALALYSRWWPYVSNTTLALSSALSASGREIDISSIAELVSVVALWAPYSASDTEHTGREFAHWVDEEVLFLTDGDVLSSSDTARIFYTKVHTLSGLDGAVATTFRVGHDDLIVLAAAGQACLSRAVDLTEQVTLDRRAIEQLRDLAEDFFNEFRRQLLLPEVEAEAE